MKYEMLTTGAKADMVEKNVVDRIYLGHLPGASSLALTGVGLIFPIVALVTAFCNLFATGGTPLCAIARGAGHTERAEKIMNNTFSMLLIMSAVLMGVGYGFRKPILYLFGASDDTYPYADAYLTVYLHGDECHRNGPNAAHRNPQTRQMLHEYGQRKWMEETGGTTEDFIREFGRNYLDVPEVAE